MLRYVPAFLAFVAWLPVSVANAQDKPTKPEKIQAKPEVKTEAQKVTVVSVTGPAQKLIATNGKKWLPLEKGEELDELTIIRTGLRAKVVLKFADRGEFTIVGGTKMGISEFSKKGAEVKARIGLKYGTVHASITKGKGPSDFKIATPVATISVRGSRSVFGLFLDNPSPLKIGVNTGGWNVGGNNVGPGEHGDNQGTPSGQIAGMQFSPNLSPTGTTGSEQHGTDNNGGGRGGFSPGSGFGGSGVPNMGSHVQRTETPTPVVTPVYEPPNGNGNGNGNGY